MANVGEGPLGSDTLPASRFVNPYVTERRKRGDFTKGSARQVECVLYRFCEIAGNPSIDALSRATIEAWLGKVSGKLARSTVRNRLSTIRRWCKWLVERYEIPTNPCDAVEGPRQPRSVPRALPAASVVDLYDFAPDARAELIISLMVQEGLRCLEVASLQLADIDERQRTMRITGKFGHERLLPLSDETWTAMRRYLAEHPSTSAGPLIRRYDQTARSLSSHYVSDLVRGWLRDAGVKQRAKDGVGAHSLRHTAATDVLRANGGNVVLVQQMLGHTSLATTQVYLRTYPEDLRKAMNGRSYKRRAEPEGGGALG